MADEGVADAVRTACRGEPAVPVAGLPVDGGPGVVGSSPAAQLYAGAPMASQPAGQLPELDELLATAEAAEVATGAGQHRAPDPAGRSAAQRMAGRSIAAQPAAGSIAAQPAAAQPATGQNFAALLRTLTEADPDGGSQLEAAPAGAAPVIAQRPVRPAPEPGPKSNVTAIGRPDARARLEMLMQLRQVGVPVSVNPRPDTHTLYEALENILEELPAPALPPRGAGEVLAVVGSPARRCRPRGPARRCCGSRPTASAWPASPSPDWTTR